jgi:hypothetical protein
VEAEPFSGVAVPLDLETVAADPIEADEGGVELFAEIFREAGTVSLNEAMLGAVPFADNVDGIVEFGGPYGRQEAGLIEVLDQVLAGRSNRRLFRRRETRCAHCPCSPRAYAAWARFSAGFRQFHGSNSVIRLAG